MHILHQRQLKEENKRCADCKTTKTPLWRGGPAGPKSLCNACGIRLRKKKRAALLGLNSDSGNITEKYKTKTGIDDVGPSGIKIQGRDMKVHQIVEDQKWKMKLREEEQAAFLLMALSTGY